MTARRDDLSRSVSRTLQAGGLISIGTVAVGVVLGLEPVARAGLLLVVLTPIGRLAAAGSTFVRQGEVRYAIATLVVLALLVGGLAVAATTSGVGS